MARRTRPTPGSRGERVQRIKDAIDDQKGRELTVAEVADLLNDAARDFGFEQRWSGPRFSKMVHGQEPALEDAACLLEVDPRKRGWDWLVFGDRRDAQNVDLTRVEAVPSVAARKPAKARR